MGYYLTKDPNVPTDSNIDLLATSMENLGVDVIRLNLVSDTDNIFYDENGIEAPAENDILIDKNMPLNERLIKVQNYGKHEGDS